MSRLLVSCGALTSGGAERVLSILSGPFAENFDSVTYLMWVDAPIFYPIDSRVELVSVEKEAASTNKLTKARWFRRYVKNTGPDLILSFLTPFNMLALASLTGIRQRIVVAERNDPFQIPGGKLMAFLRDLLYGKATAILVQTHYAASCFKGRLADKVRVIYNPIIMDRSLVGSALKTPKEDLVVSVGRLQPQKDQKTLIDAFSIFKRTHPSYKLVIYGDGPSRKDLEEYIRERKLQDSVLLPGTTVNIWDAVRPAKLFVLSSLMEGMSNAMIEAMCLGLPVISTKVAGATELIRNGENGYLVDQKDATTIAERMTAIADDEESAARMGCNASSLYDMLTHEAIVPEWVEYINSRLK